jgi:hypothetical protein
MCDVTEWRPARLTVTNINQGILRLGPRASLITWLVETDETSIKLTTLVDEADDRAVMMTKALNIILRFGIDLAAGCQEMLDARQFESSDVGVTLEANPGCCIGLGSHEFK